jgi:hypothetical protein
MVRLKVEKTVYFDSPEEADTELTLKAAKERAEALNIRDIVVASTTGETGVKALEVFQGFNLVIVRHHTGFEQPNVQQMHPKYDAEIVKKGAKLLTATHALSGVERSIRRKLNTYGPVEILAEGFKTLGNGLKVCIEIAVMAADAGLVSADRDCVAVAGSGGGADTAVVLKPANSNNFFDLYVREIVVKPRSRD